MSEHVSLELLDRPRGKRVNPADRVAADLHAAACLECREAIRNASKRGEGEPLVEALRRHGSRHLTYEGMKSFLSGELPAEERADLGGHVSECDPCARLLEDLRQFMQSMEATKVEPMSLSIGQRFGRWLRTGPGALAAASLAIFLVAVPVMNDFSRRGTTESLVSRQTGGAEKALDQIPNAAVRERVRAVLAGKAPVVESGEVDAESLVKLFPDQHLIRGAIFQSAGRMKEAAAEYRAEIAFGDERTGAARLLQALPSLP